MHTWLTMNQMYSRYNVGVSVSNCCLLIHLIFLLYVFKKHKCQTVYILLLLLISLKQLVHHNNGVAD